MKFGALVRSFLKLCFVVSCLVLHSMAIAAENINLAPAGTASQSSTGFGGVASRANDGNTDGDYFAALSTQHNELPVAENWWQVDLGEIKFIDTINTWNRTDCCSDRTNIFHVFVSDVPFTGDTIAASQAQAWVSDFFINGIMGTPTTIVINRTGRYVRVQLATANHLHMAEVEVIGDDPVSELSVEKTADITTNVGVGEVITYTYKVTNTGTLPVSNIKLVDSHNASGPVPVPGAEVLSADNQIVGDSSDDIPDDGIWTVLFPDDEITFTASYEVVQSDIDTLQ